MNQKSKTPTTTNVPVTDEDFLALCPKRIEIPKRYRVKISKQGIRDGIPPKAKFYEWLKSAETTIDKTEGKTNPENGA